MQFFFENHELDVTRRELKRGIELVPLEPQVFDLLVYLLQSRDRVVSKDDLIANVWGGRIVSDSALDSRINAVRKAIGDSGNQQKLIRTFARKGIRFIGTVTETAEGKPVTTINSAPSGERPTFAVLPFQISVMILPKNISQTGLARILSPRSGAGADFQLFLAIHPSLTKAGRWTSCRPAESSAHATCSKAAFEDPATACALQPSSPTRQQAISCGLIATIANLATSLRFRTKLLPV